jgi:polyisoprenoid-binding protein YceI
MQPPAWRSRAYALAALLGGAAYLASPGGPIAAAPTAAASARLEYRFDSKTSRLTVETETAGLSSMFGHDHKFDARDFAGRLALVPDQPASAVLELDVRGDGLTLMEDVSDDARREIAAALRDAVLETAKYPEISLRSRSVRAKKNADGSFDVKLTADLTLHGVRRTIIVPAHVVPTPTGVRATGALELRPSDFRIKPYTFAKGTVKVRDTIAISFDLVARK